MRQGRHRQCRRDSTLAHDRHAGLAGNFATTGAFDTTLVQSASITLTLPARPAHWRRWREPRRSATRRSSGRTRHAGLGVLTNCTGHGHRPYGGAATTAGRLRPRHNGDHQLGTLTTLTVSGALNLTLNSAAAITAPRHQRTHRHNAGTGSAGNGGAATVKAERGPTAAALRH